MRKTVLIANSNYPMIKRYNVTGARQINNIVVSSIIFIGAFLGLAAVPFSSSLQVADFNVGVFYIIAVGSIGIIGIVMAGWASNNKWSLYGAMRSAAQIISYEIPAGLSIIVPIMMAGTLNLQELIVFQSGTIWGILPNWIIFNNPFSFIAFFTFFISAVAEPIEHHLIYLKQSLNLLQVG